MGIPRTLSARRETGTHGPRVDGQAWQSEREQNQNGVYLPAKVHLAAAATAVKSDDTASDEYHQRLDRDSPPLPAYRRSIRR